jgi:hypothetical protein
MKIRSDFVTNSSSSSFVIATTEALTRETLYNVFQVSDAAHPLINNIIDTIFHCAEKITEDNFVAYHDYEVKRGEYDEILGKGYFLYDGDFSDDGASSAERYLCNTSLNIVRDDFIMIHEGDY